MIDVTLACEDTNSKLFDVVTFADVDIEESVDDRSVPAWEHLARFGNRLTTVFYLVVVFLYIVCYAFGIVHVYHI